MKRLLKLVVVLALATGGWVVYQYTQTGKWSVLPVELSPEEQRLRELEAELAEIRGKIAAQERTLGRAGAAPTPALELLYSQRDRLQAEIDALRAAVQAER
ncbi:MAG: hypothetical protein KatS3mg102_0118 [Planctomycetota bacterium]|nr:MAG: hypothetical protein KatS3mg102_0118 [Planctomycetota bacterium]